MSEPSLARSSAIMASGTVVSRITGVLRDIALTTALGFYIVSDAYSLGNTVPNVIYMLVVGGALNAIFIPQLVRRMKEDPDGGKAYTDRLLTVTFSVLLILSVLAVALAPAIIDLFATTQYTAGQRELAVAFAQLCLPQIFFYGAYALLTQVLNARGRFGAPMFAPVLNNVIAIATFVTFIAIAGTGAAADGVLTRDQVLILGLGTTLGVTLQAIILIPLLWKAGYLWRPRFDWRGGGLGKVGTLALWTLGLVVVNQAGYIVITRLATLANVNATDAGGVPAGLTTYLKANLIFMLPHSVITVSIVTAMLPALSRIAHAGDFPQVARDITRTMRLVAAMILPIAVIMLVTGPGIAVLLFGYGAATPEQAALMGSVVSVFVTGLLPFTLWFVVLRGFYAMEDTRSPFWIAVIFNAVTLVVAIPLFYAVSGGAQIAMLALGYVAGFWAAFVSAWWLLTRRLRREGAAAADLAVGPTVRALMRMLAAATGALAVMVVGQYAMTRFVTGGGAGDRWGVLLNVIVAVALGSGAYLGLARIFSVTDVTDVIGLIRHRLRRSATPPPAA
jgi:putative peptidoglycan lipid II flippase